MTQREKIVFIGITLSVWVFHAYAQKFFINGIGGRSQYLIMLNALPFVLALFLVYIVISQRKLVSIGAMILLLIYALFLSLFQTHFVQIPHLHNFFTAIMERQGIKAIITPLAIIIDSEGIDLFLYFFLATISRYVAYSFRKMFGLKEFKTLWVVWFFIVSISEFIQSFIVKQRYGNIFDILNNMIGVTVALLLCLGTRKTYDKSLPGSSRFGNTDEIIKRINHLIHFVLNKKWMSKEWKRMESGEDPSQIHPFVVIAFKAKQQIKEFISKNTFGITDEIFELTELATKINNLSMRSTIGLDKRLMKLTSTDFSLYRTARYEIQIAGMLLQRGHEVKFIEESGKQTPDILVSNLNENCEIECKHKDPAADQIDYIRSIYNNTQTARKQFSKTCPGIITIEINKLHFKDFELEIERLKEEIFRAMRNSSSISAVLLTSKVFMEDKGDYIYRHLVKGFFSPKPRYPVPEWLSKNLININ